METAAGGTLQYDAENTPYGSWIVEAHHEIVILGVHNTFQLWLDRAIKLGFRYKEQSAILFSLAPFKRAAYVRLRLLNQHYHWRLGHKTAMKYAQGYSFQTIEWYIQLRLEGKTDREARNIATSGRFYGPVHWFKRDEDRKWYYLLTIWLVHDIDDAKAIVNNLPEETQRLRYVELLRCYTREQAIQIVAAE